MINRNSVVPRLAKMLYDEYKDAMKHYDTEQKIELTEHLLEVIELLRTYQKTKDDTIYKEWGKKEDVLLKKYREKFKPYKIKFFHTYFEFERVALFKDLYTEDEYNSLPPGEQGLSELEINNYLNQVNNGLRASLDILYMEEPSKKKAEKREVPETTIGDLPDKDITRSRQMLAIYYMLKAGFDIEHRKNSNISDVAKFVHLMTGTKFNGLTNSDIYKKYKGIPSHKEGAELIKDLKFIRPYFMALEIDKAVQMINADIEKALLDIPLSERKKYRGE